jgi:exopolyphosphatase/guanosine-5'-triphosphate,3'-diphosphate pyrophosphatase
LKLAAIDIGSNAIRFLVYRVLEHKGEKRFKKLEYIRFPLRLGHDVFTEGQISEGTKEKFYRLMNAFSLLIDLYEVDAQYACATSALRESANGSTIIKEVEQLFGLKIHLISGNEEAKLINNVVIDQLPDGQFIHIDVGGGSTELNVIIDRKKAVSRSFNLGSVRGLEKHNSPEKLKEMFEWIQRHVYDSMPIKAVGTGGNINKLYELSSNQGSGFLQLNELYRVQQLLKSMSLEERIYQLDLNPDRADVILPASKLYAHAMESANASRILVPDVGLKDGIIHMLYKQQ